jgi:hypothetical protein
MGVLPARPAAAAAARVVRLGRGLCVGCVVLVGSGGRAGERAG